tara:strand:- start:238 stop:432 length:195 start_codon:yes stop_codon:yes gene_type:complete
MCLQQPYTKQRLTKANIGKPKVSQTCSYSFSPVFDCIGSSKQQNYACGDNHETEGIEQQEGQGG